jgi:hypothetical protein
MCRILPVVLIVAAGCSQGTKPVVESHHDSEQARTALVAALDAWRQGKAKTLVQRQPPIRFVDDDFLMGFHLSDYALEEPDATIDLHKDVPVILVLRDSKGKTVRREARYQVATEPRLAVLRSDR